MSLFELAHISHPCRAIEALAEGSLSVGKEELRAVSGPNGVGKTALFNLVSGCFPPSEGDIVFDGANIAGIPRGRLVARGTVRTFQITEIFLDFTVYENLSVVMKSVTDGCPSISASLALNIAKTCNKRVVSEESRLMTADRPARLRRRTVLAFAVAATGFATAGAQRSAEPVSAALHRLFGGSAGLQELGRIFNARQANAAARLLARLEGVEGTAVRSRLDALRKEDFAAGRVVVINGWVLARIEAEACAFIAAA